MNRRQFLETTLAAGAAMLLPPGRLWAAGMKPRVIVIGAGFSGLFAAAFAGRVCAPNLPRPGRGSGRGFA